MTNNISPEAKAAQDAARVSGKFGEQSHTAPPAEVANGVVQGAAVRRTVEEIQFDIDALTANKKLTEEREFELNEEFLVAAILQEFPYATEAVIYNASEDDGDSNLSVLEVRGHTEANSEGEEVQSLWTEPEDIFDNCDDTYRVLEGLATSLDSDGGIRHFAQPADATHPNPWFGIKL